MHSFAVFTNVLSLKPRFLRPISCIRRANASTVRQVKLKITPTQPQERPKMSSEETAKMVEKLRLMSDHNMTDFDVWSMPSPLLDLRVPVGVFSNGASPRKIYASLEHNLSNYVENFLAMRQMAKGNSFPWNPTYSAWSHRIFGASSTSPKGWLAPLRDTALDTYERLNAAIASGHKDVINQLTAGHYKERLLERAKLVSKTKKTRLKWELHSLTSPVRVVSFRAQVGNMSAKPLSFGTKFIAQACIKFDTMQCLTPEKQHTEPRRVVEYLVFEKKMWYDEPWKIRDQLWPTLSGNKITSL